MSIRADQAERGRQEPAQSGSRRMTCAWSELRVEYSWLPPFRGAAPTKPNRIEVVFSAHDDVRMAQEDRTYDIRASPGGMFVVGEHPTILLNVGTFSDTLEMYPDVALLEHVARERGIRGFALTPTLAAQRVQTFARDPVVLGIAHLFRRACMNRLSVPDVEASGLAHTLVERLVTLQHGEPAASSGPRRLGARTIARLSDYIESALVRRLTLSELARVAGLSPFHFARCFKTTTGLAPHQYVMARRIELAKRLIVTTDQPVRDVAWSIGFENLSHFRRQFVAQIGVTPGDLRRATRVAT